MRHSGEQSKKTPAKVRRLVVVLGTRAQTIKMAPLLAELEGRGLEVQLLMTGQHQETISELLQEFGIQTSPFWLYKGPEIKGIAQAVKWMMAVFWKLWRQRDQWAPKPRAQTIVLAHGDTFSTVLAAVAGSLVGSQVAHVEAGLRSYNWRQPFPEELNRLIVSRLTHIAYCPGQWACSNLDPKGLEIVDTKANTILDALRTATIEPPKSAKPTVEHYAVASIHRFENLYSRERLSKVLDILHQLTDRMRVVVVLHPITRKRLIELDELQKLEKNQMVDLLPRMTYLPFMRLISEARLVITDGGSNQEELSYLGVPTLLMRLATERQEGLGENVVLSKFDGSLIDAFIEKSSDTKADRPQRQLPDVQPVSIICEDLQARLG